MLAESNIHMGIVVGLIVCTYMTR